jgi:colanic acid/amylovoran biosynthesis glycosyltransferase
LIHTEQGHAYLATGKRIVYIIGTYPDLTKTFIDREILEAKRVGLNVAIIAMRRSNAGSLSSAVQKLMDEIIYLVPASAIRLSRAHGYFLVSRFRNYFQTLWYLLSREHPTLKARLKTLLHFGAGVLAASYLRKTTMPDHVHAHFADGAAVIAIVISRLLNIPYSLTAHAYDIYRAPVFLTDKVAGARFVTTCTAFNKHHLEQATGHTVELIYHGLDFEAIREIGVARKRLQPPLILSVGRLQEKKGFSYLIEACAQLKKQGLDFRCEIVGDGPEGAILSSLVRALDLQDTVTLCGALPNAEVMLKYSRASVFVLPCCVTDDGDRDGIPNVILEAMAFGLPVVSTDVSGVPEVVRDSETGLLVQSRNVDQLSKAIARVLADTDEAGILGRNASEFVQREFDIRQNIKCLGRLLSR